MSDETKSARQSQLLPRLLIFLGVITVGLVIASAAFAGWSTINTDGGTVDAAWGTPSYTESCNVPARPGDDIQNAWVAYDGSQLYFRIQACGSPIFSNTANMRAIAAIDCNNNGTFDEKYVAGPDGDRRIVFYASNGAVWVLDGQNNPVIQLDATHSEAIGADAEWRVELTNLYPGCRGSTGQINIVWAMADTSTNPATTIDQTDTLYAFNNPMDFGDAGQANTTPAVCGTPAANNWATLLQCNGPRHGMAPPTPGGQPLRLGSEAVDPDGGNLQNATFNADDTTPPPIPPGFTPQPTPVGISPDDEQGIAPALTPWKTGGTATPASVALTFQIQGAASARLSCWIDFNKNGNWQDSTEYVIANAAISSGTTSRTITVPGGKTFPNSFPVRCRVYPNNGAGTPVPTVFPYGAIEFGEVEDHLWQFDANGLYITPTPVATYTPLAVGPTNTPTPTPTSTSTNTPTPTPTNTPGTPVAITNLAAGKNGGDAKLTWANPSPNDSAVVKSHPSNPYFASNDAGATPEATVMAAPWAWSDTGVMGDTNVQTIYYIVLGRVGLVEAGPSNRVGLFEFSLVQGAP